MRGWGLSSRRVRPAGFGKLTPDELATLRVLCDTLAPEAPLSSASEAKVPEQAEHVVEDYFTPEQRRDFVRFLRGIDHVGSNLFLSGVWGRFRDLDGPRREQLLQGWAHSRIGSKRRAFQAIKRLTLFLYYAVTPEEEARSAWREMGYVPSPRAGLPALEPPAPPPGVVVSDTPVDITADVCIVGSGAGGALIAARLAAAGLSVVVLEAGAWRTASTFPQREAEAMDTMFQNHGLLATEDLAINVLAGRTVGGGTTINWMTCLRPPSWVREEWKQAAGWDDVVTPAFDALLGRIEARLGVSTGESLVNRANDVLRRGCEKLGYVAGRDYEVVQRNARGCQGRCDFCTFGCVYDAKQSTQLTYLTDALEQGARLYPDTAAATIETEAGHVRGVLGHQRTRGREIPVHVRASTVVVAAGAVQTPALLLRSGIRFPGVGFGLRLHPTSAVVAEYGDPVEMWKGPMQTIVVRKHQLDTPGGHGPWLEAVPAHPGLSAIAFPWTSRKAHQERMQRLKWAAATIVLVRDADAGRVRIDAHGDPLLDYRLATEDRKNLVDGFRWAARIHQAAGALRLFSLHSNPVTAGDGSRPLTEADVDQFGVEVARRGIVENAISLFSAHPMGSARAGRDPRNSTAGPTGECHEIQGLWVGDGSLLPTAPGVNPMVSILGIAERTADRLLGARHRSTG